MNTEARVGIVSGAIVLVTTGTGNDVDLDNSGPLITSGYVNSGIIAATYGGAASISISNSGEITTNGDAAQGIRTYTMVPGATGVGGAGGGGGPANGDPGGNAGGTTNGTDGLSIYNDGADGAAVSGVGNGGIRIINAASITTSGDLGTGILVESFNGGGQGGDGGNGNDATGGIGGNADFTGYYGASGGAGGNASADGGAGGNGFGGPGGGVVIINRAEIATAGSFAAGIFATVNGSAIAGGDGGNGGVARGGAGGYGSGYGEYRYSYSGGDGGSARSVGGAGGDAYGGASGTVRIVNYGDVVTTGAYASGIEVGTRIRATFGGSGGNGGVATGGAGGGGDGGYGGIGGSATADGGSGGVADGLGGGDGSVTHFGRITTSGSYSHGIVVNSSGGDGRGGAGGAGGSATGGYGGYNFGYYANTANGPGGDAGSNGGRGSDGMGGAGGITTVTNNGHIVTTGDKAQGIRVRSFAGRGTGGGGGDGGTAAAGAGGNVQAAGFGGDGGNASSNGGAGGAGIGGGGGEVVVINEGHVRTAGRFAHAIYAITIAGDSIGGTAGAGGTAVGGNGGGLAYADAGGIGGDGGNANANGGNGGNGIGGHAGKISIVNTGDIWTSGAGAHGIYARTAIGASINGTSGADGLAVNGVPGFSPSGGGAGGLAQAAGGGGGAGAGGDSASIAIDNSGTIVVAGDGIRAVVTGGSATVRITNSGEILGGTAGIYVASPNATTIDNSGRLSAVSLLAIQSYGPGDVQITNSGVITGFVLLDADDRFINKSGGVFEARLTSDFDATGPGGNDLFVNQAGATVHVLNHNGQPTAFANLERFENSGLISLMDNKPGDSFTLSNTPGGTDLDFAASGNSTLAVDAFLGGPGNSSSDTFTVEGDVSGVTTVQVVNTNYGPAVFNPSGIRVVTATGATQNPDAFQLAQPIDTGFFHYDLFFTPTGSGFWELRSFAGPGAFLLPQLVTAAQDIWHQSSSTWFDRTSDLRVLLSGGAAPTAYDPGGKSLIAAGPYSLTPAVWARASGSWLDRDDTVRTTAYGRDYSFDLDRELQTLDFQGGVDMGKRDVWGQGDALVFGLLGGFVHGDLDYDALARSFNFDGGQVGAYATYLNGGLFVDTLLNVHLYSLEGSTLSFPNSLDANTVGLRTDTGYRFGSFSGGPFLEPLATIEVTWADIDGFSLGGNTVTFDDDANVRGRLGLRAGTTMNAWEGTLMEPFVTGSLWGNLTDDNQATLVSTGRTFRFEDQLDDVWGEVSAGVNVFNFSQTTAVFAKVDVTFGDDLTGVGGKAGMRVNW